MRLEEPDQNIFSPGLVLNGKKGFHCFGASEAVFLRFQEIILSGFSKGAFRMIILNLAIFLITAVCIWLYSRRSPMHLVLRYFTTLSNILCAVSSLLVAIFRLAGNVPQAVLLLKYAGTVSVTVTFLTCMFFLGPFVCGYKVLLTGCELFMHMICPLLALFTFFAWDKPAVPFSSVLIGMLPMVLYAFLYLNRVVLCPEEKRWPDFYAFNREGKWPLSFFFMVLGVFLISTVLWAL
ncbi:MAG: hypothetical protein IJL88_09900 [Clostridia bacterium]|nr:hypothetical protein [Clostridia bacterium]